MNVGHADLQCSSCHRPAPGTTRQQLQANARTSIGLRGDYVDFGLQRVTSDRCRSCHDRPDDRHPVHRFLEPRFAEVRAVLSPHECMSCHREHTGRRATVEPDACRHCHAELELQHDPVLPPHADLVGASAWETCLGCHDFHGNHAMEVPTDVRDAIAPADIRRYLAGGASPYDGALRHRATLDDETVVEAAPW